MTRSRDDDVRGRLVHSTAKRAHESKAKSIARRTTVRRAVGPIPVPRVNFLLCSPTLASNVRFELWI